MSRVSRSASTASLATAAAFLMIAFQTAGKVARDGFFLSNFPVSKLPSMIAVAGVVSLVVVVVASWSMSRISTSRFASTLIRLLAWDAVAPLAGSVLVRIGPPACPELAATLADTSEDFVIRRPLEEDQEEDVEDGETDARRPGASRSLRHVFNLLTLVLPAATLAAALTAVRCGDVRLRGTALEYLESIIPHEIWEKLAPWLEEGY